MDNLCAVYVLRSARDGNLYIGMTNDLKRRLKEHQQGKSTSNRHRRPFELIYAESFTTRVDAANASVISRVVLVIGFSEAVFLKGPPDSHLISHMASFARQTRPDFPPLQSVLVG